MNAMVRAIIVSACVYFGSLAPASCPRCSLTFGALSVLGATTNLGDGALAFGAGPIQQPSTAAKRGGNPEAAKIKNPVASTPESVGQGRRLYQRFCSRCHGSQGKGDGGAGGATQPSDLTDDHWDYGSTDGEIFSVIRDGVSVDMEGYGERISETDIWNVVNYIRSLGPTR